MCLDCDSFCENQNVHLKFLKESGRQFTLHYVRGPSNTVGVTCTYDTGLGARHEFWGQLRLAACSRSK